MYQYLPETKTTEQKAAAYDRMLDRMSAYVDELKQQADQAWEEYKETTAYIKRRHGISSTLELPLRELPDDERAAVGIAYDYVHETTATLYDVMTAFEELRKA